MRLEVLEPTIFKNIFENIDNLTDNIHLKINHEGMKFTCLDNAHIQFTQVQFTDLMFQELPDKEYELIVDAYEFKKILSTLKENITIEFDKDNITISSKTANGDTTYTVQSYTDDTPEPVPPMIEYPVNIHVPFQFIKQSSDNISLFANNFFFKTQDQKLIVESADTTNIETKMEYPLGDEVDDVTVKLSLAFFRRYLKFNKISDEINLLLGDDLPLYLHMQNDYVRLDGLIAPRLNEQ